MADFPKLARIKQDDENMEKLHSAARRGQTELIRRLTASGIDPAIQNRFGCTGLHLACKNNHVGAVKEFAGKCDTSQLWHGQRPLHLAVQSGNAEIVKTLVEAVKDAGKPIDQFVNECDEYDTDEAVPGVVKHVVGQTALHFSVMADNLAMMKMLLSLGASATSKDRQGETPIMRAIEFNRGDAFTLLVTSVTNLRLDVCDRAGRSSLHWAILFGREEMARKLLDLGHDITGEDQDKVTPMLLAANTAMYALLEVILGRAEPFLVLNSTFHNGSQVLPERMAWHANATDEAAKAETIKVLQKRLDLINKDRAVDPKVLASAQGKKPPAATQSITLAPSAPVRK